MYIYVIRWESRISDETESGNFEVCYTDEAEAKTVMKKDYEETFLEWKRSDIGDLVETRVNKSGDFREIHVDGEDYYDYYEWHIDKLEVKD